MVQWYFLVYDYVPCPLLQPHEPRLEAYSERIEATNGVTVGANVNLRSEKPFYRYQCMHTTVYKHSEENDVYHISLR